MFKTSNPTPKASMAILVAAVALCAGCSNFYWPQHGHSGLAEEHPHMVHWHYNRAQLDLIDMQITDARQDIHILRHDGAVTYFPALMHEIDMQMVLVEREFEGHFYKEAENNLAKLQRLIREAQMSLKKRPT